MHLHTVFQTGQDKLLSDSSVAFTENNHLACYCHLACLFFCIVNVIVKLLLHFAVLIVLLPSNTRFAQTRAGLHISLTMVPQIVKIITLFKTYQATRCAVTQDSEVQAQLTVKPNTSLVVSSGRNVASKLSHVLAIVCKSQLSQTTRSSHVPLVSSEHLLSSVLQSGWKQFLIHKENQLIISPD